MSFSEAAPRGEVRLTTDGRTKADPVFIRGGSEIVFTVLESPTQLSLMRLRLADGTVERLHPGATTSEFEAAFSPDGRYYAFVQSRANLNLKLVIRDTKLNRDALFDPGGGFAGMRRPAVAPDGSRVVFSLPNAAGQQLVSVDAEGKDRKDLTRAGINNWPAYSPDGKRLAFGSSRDGDFEVYAMDADGGGARRLTRSRGLDARPAWSPDGRRIAFTSNRDGCYQIYVMNADGGGARPVRRTGEREDYAAWHPDGKRLVVVAEGGGRSDLYLIEVPG
jgi:Tol biopolymer transport system component